MPHQAGAAAVNAAPGDIISGKITMSDSGSIQLRLSDDTVLKAQVDDNIRLVPGDNVSFQVKSTDNGLVLTPLGTNTAAGASAEAGTQVGTDGSRSGQHTDGHTDDEGRDADRHLVTAVNGQAYGAVSVC
jgi:hypothetical protein